MLEIVLIRDATLADRESMGHCLALSSLSPEGVLSAGSSYWVAEDKQICGVIGIEWGRTAALLRSAAVLPSRQGSGIGSRLVQHACNACAATGRQQIYLFSTGAGTYWQRQGFVTVPVFELVTVLGETFQVRQYARSGWLVTELAWRKTLA